MTYKSFRQELSLIRNLCRVFGLAICCWFGLAAPASALTGNEQVSLAGTGKFEALVSGMELMLDKQPMKSSDWYSLCYGYSRVKHYGKILDCLDSLDKSLAKGDTRTRLFGLDDATAASHLMRAEALIELAEYDPALVQVQKALDWYQREKSDDKDIFINALAAKSLATLALGRRAEAERLSAELERFSLGMTGGDYVGAKSLAMARVNMALGNWQKVLDALAQDKIFGLRSFLDNLASGAFLLGINNWVWIELPRAFMQTKALLELGQLDAARSGYDKLLAVPQVKANGEIYWMALYDRGRIAERQGQLEEAERFFQEAAEVIERQRRSINSEANKIGFVGDKQAVYASMVANQFRQGRFGQSFESMERGKSRALVDLLASNQSQRLISPKSANAAKVTQVLERIRNADLDSRRQDESRIRSVSQAGGSNELQTLASALPSSLASLVSVSRLDLKEAQSLVKPDEALIEYFAAGDELFATLVQSSSVHGVRINASQIESIVRSLRQNMQEGSPQALGQLQTLHKLLIEPLLPNIRVKHLSIVPHGVLHYLPFGALNDGKQDLIDRFTLRILPSLAVLKYLRPSQAKGIERLLVLGNPDLGRPDLDLPSAQNEAEKLATKFKAEHLLLRKKATRTAFQALAPSAAFIHVASHGQFEAGKPLQSGLILAADKPGGGINAGRLTVSDLYELALDAELVTLSACETGLGAVASGDDVVGLTRGFLYAGVSTVIASLWQVDDEATTYLMLQMYEHLQRGGYPEALRKAQIETRAKYPHPMFWAAFYLTGLN